MPMIMFDLGKFYLTRHLNTRDSTTSKLKDGKKPEDILSTTKKKGKHVDEVI